MHEHVSAGAMHKECNRDLPLLPPFILCGEVEAEQPIDLKNEGGPGRKKDQGEESWKCVR